MRYAVVAKTIHDGAWERDILWFANEVQKYMDDGWQPQGDIVVFAFNTIIQAVVKK